VIARSGRDSPILLKNSVNDQMTKVFCVLSAVAYRGDDGGASYTRNLAQTAPRGVKVASDSAAIYRKNSKGISMALHIRVFQHWVMGRLLFIETDNIGSLK
jgi:hypothetical protein